MTHIAPNSVANTFDALADQIASMVVTQQAPAQTAALAARMAELGRMLRMLDFRSGVRLGQRAEAVQGRAVARPYQPYTADELAGLVTVLRENATAARERARHPGVAGAQGGDAA